MAERRMFAKTIVLSDAFLDMPCSARCLYMTLGMVADDDGFVNNPRSVMRQSGATDDDMKLLVAKKFVLIFDSGVIVIKHWRINNYLRGDRYVSTKYIDERSELEIDENGGYKRMESEDVAQIEAPKTSDLRKRAYEMSDLPYSFEYKIRQSFSGSKCPYCGCKMDLTEKSSTAPTIQHNKPISKGGKHELDNISVLCKTCNVSLQNQETGPLNNEDVKVVWNHICNNPTIDYYGIAEKILGIPVGTPVGIPDQGYTGKDRIVKDSIVKDNLSIIPEVPDGTPDPTPKEESKKRYGQNGKVLLTDAEYQRLMDEFGSEQTEKAIQYLDGYIVEKGYKSKSHNLSIRRWVFEAIAERERRKPNAKARVPLGCSGNPGEAEIEAVRRLMEE